MLYIGRQNSKDYDPQSLSSESVETEQIKSHRNKSVKPAETISIPKVYIKPVEVSEGS